MLLTSLMWIKSKLAPIGAFVGAFIAGILAIVFYRRSVVRETEERLEGVLEAQSKGAELDFKNHEDKIKAESEAHFDYLGNTWDEFERLHPSGSADLSTIAKNPKR